jgi:hypothetical protein
MVKTIVILGALALVPMQKPVCPSPGPTNWEQEEVVRKVKTLRVEEIHYSYTKPERELKKRVVFDTRGNYVEIEEPDMLPHIRRGIPAPVYTFNSRCQPVERRETEIVDGLVKTTFRYDEWNREIESAGFDDQGRLVYREISLYGSQGITEQIETIRVHPQHFRPMRYDIYRDTRTEFRYLQGNEIDEIEYDFTGKYYGKYTRRYDDKKHLLEETRYDELDRPIRHIARAYDSDGRLTSEEEYQSFTYDTAHNLVSGAIKTSAGFFQMGTRYLYVYDSHGNWIEKRGLEMRETNGQRSLTLDSVTYRTITYFD